MIKRYLLLGLFFMVAQSVHASSPLVSSSLMLDEEHGEAISMDIRKDQMHSQTSFSIKRENLQGKIFYKLNEQGRGNYDRYKDVTWTKEAWMFEEDGLLYNTSSEMNIYDRRDQLIVKLVRTYDYDEKRIIFQRIASSGDAFAEEIYPLNGPTCDDTNLVHFLKTFVAKRKEKEFQQFYLLSNEPKLYKVNIVDRGVETVGSPFGEKKARKLQLIGDAGPLTKILIRFVPSTFVWYTEQYPHDWLQYEGLESGPSSANIRTHLTHRKPAIE